MRDMQPASKLLTLCFLILMGTELTQVGFSLASPPPRPNTSPLFFSLSPQRHFLLNLESTKENWSGKLQLCAPIPRHPPFAQPTVQVDPRGLGGGEHVGGRLKRPDPRTGGQGAAPVWSPRGVLGGTPHLPAPLVGQVVMWGWGAVGPWLGFSEVRGSLSQVPAGTQCASAVAGPSSSPPSTPAPHLGVALLILGDI